MSEEYVYSEETNDDNNENIYTIKDINNIINNTLTNELNNIYTVTGELTNVKLMKGTLYAKIKDKESELSLVVFSVDKKTKHNFVNGDSVVVKGRIKYYTEKGYINFSAISIDKKGIGDIALIYEQIKNKYNNMGYFSNKKNPPKVIKTIGIATSLDGAALQDILAVLNKSGFKGNIIIKGCIVQGLKCPNSVVDAINFLEKKNVDLIMISRGGGSIEDLMGFSDPKVIECLFKCSKYTISAVGHEIDTMLSDYVADKRVPTPSVGAETICQMSNTYINDIKNYISEIKNISCNILDNINKYHEKINELRYKITKPDNYIANTQQTIASMLNAYREHIFAEINAKKLEINNLRKLCDTFDYKEALNKGFCIILNKNEEPIISIDDIFKGKNKRKVTIVMADGQIQLTLKKLKDNNKLGE